MGDAAEIAFYSRALKAPRIVELAGALAERARSEGWDYETYLVQVLSEEVLKPSTILLPYAVIGPVTIRSEEMAPLKTHRLGLETVPDWNRLGAGELAVRDGFISYQSISLPAPPATVCCAQIAILPNLGSKAATGSCTTHKTPGSICLAAPA